MLVRFAASHHGRPEIARSETAVARPGAVAWPRAVVARPV